MNPTRGVGFHHIHKIGDGAALDSRLETRNAELLLRFANCADDFVILRSKQTQRPHVAVTNDPIRVNYEYRTGNFAGNQGFCSVRISHLPSLIRKQA